MVFGAGDVVCRSKWLAQNKYLFSANVDKVRCSSGNRISMLYKILEEIQLNHHHLGVLRQSRLSL